MALEQLTTGTSQTFLLRPLAGEEGFGEAGNSSAANQQSSTHFIHGAGIVGRLLPDSENAEIKVIKRLASPGLSAANGG